MITTVVGNFPKVAETGIGTSVMKSINQWQKQELTEAKLDEVLQEATRTVILEQEQAGIDIVTDGQIRWEDLVTPLARAVDGFEINGLERFFDNNVYYRRPILTKTPVRKRPIFLGQFLFARSCTKKPLKVVLPGPYSVVKLSEDRYYKNERPFLRSIAEVLNEEARALADAGAVMIQFDEPALGFGKPPMPQVLEALSIATQGVKAKKAVYTYFGALNGAMEQLQKAPVDVIGIDVVSNPKSVQQVNRIKWTKELALGVVDARNTALESVTELHALFDVITKRVPKDSLYVNPNCGLEFLPYETAVQKLRRLVEAVRRYK
jgi:5-methyltetrahydropteroyltriglutamate--homocysteine methyltransferase